MGVVMLRLGDFRFVDPWGAVCQWRLGIRSEDLRGVIACDSVRSDDFVRGKTGNNLTPIYQNRRVESNLVGSHPQNHYRGLRGCIHQCPVSGFGWVL